MVASDLVKALSEFHKIKIIMPDKDGLKEGRELVTQLQMACGFPLVYVQRIGCDPMVMVWRVRDANHAMENYRVPKYQC